VTRKINTNYIYLKTFDWQETLVCQYCISCAKSSAAILTWLVRL